MQTKHLNLRGGGKLALTLLAIVTLNGLTWAQADEDCRRCVQVCDAVCSSGPCGVIPDANWVCSNFFTVPCNTTYQIIATMDCGTQCTCSNFIACAALLREGAIIPVGVASTLDCAMGECTRPESVLLMAGVNYRLCAARKPCPDGSSSCGSCDIVPDPCVAIAQLKRLVTDQCNFANCP